VSRLRTLDESQLNSETRQALEPFRTGKRLAPVYLQFANSETALRAYLQMENALQEGSLDSRAIEAVKLWVSEHTACHFCSTVHGAKASKAGLSKEQQSAIRASKPCGDKRLDMLVQLTEQLVKVPGIVPDEMLAAARSSGISDENLVDLTLIISTILFTNITNHINDTQLG